MKPHLDDDTRPLKVPVCVQSVRSIRPALTRVMGPGTGESFPIPTERRQGLVIGRGERVALRVEDPAVSREHCRVWQRPDGTMMLTDLGSANGTIVNGARVEEIILAEGDKIQVGASTVFRFALNDRMDEDYISHLYQTSIRDSLTNLYNRRYLQECLDRDLSLAKRHALPISLILIDADHFKTINDSFGHRGGDEALKELAQLLGAMQRKESIIARFGGEEFAVLLRNVEHAGAEVFAERMRVAVDRHRFSIAQGTLHVTVSVGVASTIVDGVDDPEQLIDRADRYMYLSKTRGRNCVTSARSFQV